MYREGDEVVVAEPVPNDWFAYVPSLNDYVGMVGHINIVYQDLKPTVYRIRFQNGDLASYPESVLEPTGDNELVPGNLAELLNERR